MTPGVASRQDAAPPETVTEGDAPYALPFVGRTVGEARTRPARDAPGAEARRVYRRELERYLSLRTLSSRICIRTCGVPERVSGEWCSDFWPVLHAWSKEWRIFPGAVENLSASAVAVALCRMLFASPTLISSHMGGGLRMRTLSSIALAIIVLVSPTFAQELPKGVTAADLATNNKLFLELARKGLKWEEPAIRYNCRPHLFRRYQGSRCVPDHDVRRPYIDEHRHAVVRADDRRLDQ